MKKRLLTLIFTLFVGTFSVFAQMSDPTSWTFSQKKTGDNEYALTQPFNPGGRFTPCQPRQVVPCLHQLLLRKWERELN